MSTRQYTVEECRERIAAILEEDQQLALRISRTNQQARAEIEDLDSRVRTLSTHRGRTPQPAYRTRGTGARMTGGMPQP